MFNFPILIKREQDFKFSRNLLKTVIFQAKYDTIANISKHKDDLVKALIDYYPSNKEIKEVSFEIQLGENTPMLPSLSKGGTQGYEFRSNNGQIIFAVTADSITCTVMGGIYTNFKETFSQLHKHILNVTTILNVSRLNRLATRKINVITFSKGKNGASYDVMRSYFNDVLLDNISYVPSFENITSFFSNFTMQKDNYNLILQYGLIPSSPQSPPNTQQAVLDIDLFLHNKPIGTNEIIKEMSLINDEIFNIFAWAISDELKKTLLKVDK